MSGYSAFRDIVNDFPKMRNFPKIFLRSFENVGPGSLAHSKHFAVIITL